MYRVLLNDGLQESAIDDLRNSGLEVVNEHYDKSIVGDKLKEFDALVVRAATKVTADILDKANNGRLKLIIRAGVGLDNIDVGYAEKLGIAVKNTPASSSDSVAELVIAHMLSLSRFIGISNYTMRNNQWNKNKYKGIEIANKTLGIIGMGRIGQSVAKKANALGMNVIYYTIEGKHNDLNYEYMPFDEVLKNSDFISLHIPYNDGDEALIKAKELGIIKKGTYIINCSRGRIIDEKALLEALNSGKVSGAGLDVFEEEPTSNEELINHPKVSCTPHIGGSTVEAQNRIGEEVTRIIKDYFSIN